uniref:Very-long-chain 3-oxoacyl-CoA reductase-A n=1 Tax=Cacopsylla melanoneura TaxID=428564 RepID=A0A8D8U0W7_9HEMI
MHPTASKLLCTLVRYEQPLALLGVYYLSHKLLHLALSAVSGLHYYVLSQWFPARDYRRYYGRWAVVMIERGTLSKHYAEELARKHMDIQIICAVDDKDKFETFSKYLSKTYKVRVGEVLAYNLDKDSAEGMLEFLKGKLSNLDSIGVMVNQMVARPEPKRYLDMSECEISEHIRVMLLMIHLTQFVLRGMKNQSSGVIVNIGDPSGEYPHCCESVHSASCAFMDYFSRSLSREVVYNKIHVQSLTPYLADMDDGDGRENKCTLLSITPPTVARNAVNGIGKTRSYGHFVYAVRGFFASLVPMCLRERNY